ncbi:GNAT family N-acetyltransferase [Roseobacter sp. CCS2]|uniref:GNAT family N-acetyltransferase n=1 Tax=Roseobacter sp. CCS2 TaxID=391593 RepID=UPI0000F3DFFD|nr:GNAT family N-acetyltransferase [Roseobacter sp. CCS2]EBA12345.1 acetyltranferase [Roseobacter sp. CCS2]
MIPTLQTERLSLRPYQRSDFDTYAAFMASDRAVHMDGPLDRDTAWTWFTNDVATWALYGFGTLAVEMDGKLAGGVGLVHPPHYPEPECGWFIYDGFNGMGLAAEAGRAIIDHTFATTNLASIVSYIGERNAASIRVAESLGARLDPDAPAPEEEGTLVYRHTRNSAQGDVA